MSNEKRIVLIVLDSLGVGELPDAEKYGDKGANTLLHILEKKPDLFIPNLIKMGIFRIEGIKAELENIYGKDFVKEKIETIKPIGAFGRLSEASKGKDTITGHWEITGLLTKTPFKTYPEGFPPEFMKTFEEAIGMGTLGNYPASGTEIIEDLGSEHEKTGKPIVYTSADSVFQIAANTAVIPLEKLYGICSVARTLLQGEFACGRVIARPYVTENGKRVRTSDRKDYAVSPGGKTILDHIKKSGKTVFAVGKINDIFNGHGITTAVHTKDNMDGVDKTIEAMKEEFSGIVFTNLVDFDSKYGHRRDPLGYGECLEEFDKRLPEIMANMNEGDILMLCADHGNDPIHSGFDHTREYVPILIYGSTIAAGIDLGTGNSYGDIGATVAEILQTEKNQLGTGFLKKIAKE